MPAHPTPKTAAYRIRTWKQYNDALVRRGSLTLWVEDTTLDAWRYQGPTQRGAQFEYGDTAIECLLTLRTVYHLAQVDNPLEAAEADGAYDQQTVYVALKQRGARAVIPPRRDAKITRHGNSAGPRLDRDENLRRIRQIGRKAWKEESGYHKRSLGETAMFRMKTLFGGEVSSRGPAQQATEMGI